MDNSVSCSFQYYVASGVLCPLSLCQSEHDRGRNSQKIGVQHDGKNLFLRAFSDFFKKLFRTLKPYFHLFSPVLRTTTRACVFIIFEKTPLKFFLKKGLTRGYTRAIMETLQGGYTPRPPDSVEGRADSPNGVHLVNSRSPRGQHSADRRRV